MSEVKRWTPDSPDVSFSGSDNGEWVRYLHYQALEAERDRYVAALERIELMDPDWTLGVDENMSRLQSIAGRALKGGGDEQDC